MAGTASFFLDGKERGINQDAKTIIEKRKNQPFPLSFPTKVPARLQPLALDFAVFFAGAEVKGCRDFTVLSIEELTPIQAERWTVNACGKTFAYLVTLASCNKLLNTQLVIVKRELDGRTFAGANPLDAVFEVSCPDR